MRKIIVIMIFGILCSCCMAEVGFPNGTYKVSEKGQANAEIMRDTAMFYYYFNHKKFKEAADILQTVLDRRTNAKFLLYSCVVMYKEGTFPEDRFIALAKKHPESPLLCLFFAETLEEKGKKAIALEIVENALAYRLDPPAEGEEPRGKKEKWMSKEFQALIRMYIALLDKDGAYQKGSELLKKLFTVYSREKLEVETLIYLTTFALHGQKKEQKEFYRQEAKRYIAMLKQHLAAPNDYSYILSSSSAEAFQEAGETELLEALLTETLLTNPVSASSYKNLATLYFQKKMTKCLIKALSLEILSHAIKNKKTPKGRLIFLFNAALEDGDEKIIFSQLGRIMRMELMNDELYYKMSFYYLKKNNILKARSYCMEIKNPVLRDTLMAVILSQQKKYREAMLLYMKLERDNTKSPFLKMSVAELAKKAGDKEVESQFRNEIIMKIDQSAEYQNYIAYTWAEQGINLDQAETYLKMALDADPANYAYIDSMAWVCYKKKNYPKAKEYILKALSLCGDSESQGVLLDHAGDIFAALGDRKKALFYWQRAVQSGDPDLDITSVMKKLPRPFARVIKPVRNPKPKADGPKKEPSARQKKER